MIPRWSALPNPRGVHITWEGSETKVPQPVFRPSFQPFWCLPPDNDPQFRQKVAIEEIIPRLYHLQKAVIAGLRPRTNLLTWDPFPGLLTPTPTLNVSLTGASNSPFSAWRLYNPAILARQISWSLSPDHLSWSMTLLLFCLPLSCLMIQCRLLSQFSPGFSLHLLFLLYFTINIFLIMKSCPLLFLYSFIQYAFDRELFTGIENDRRNTWVYASTPTQKMSKTHPCASFSVIFPPSPLVTVSPRNGSKWQRRAWEYVAAKCLLGRARDDQHRPLPEQS